MKKAILYCILAIGMMANAQTNNVITKKLQLENVPLGNKNDSVLVWSANKIVKHRKLSDLIQSSGGSSASKFGVEDSIANENRRFNLKNKSLEIFTDVLTTVEIPFDNNTAYYENEFWDDASKSYYETYNEFFEFIDLGPTIVLVFEDSLSVKHEVVFTREPITNPAYIYYLTNKLDSTWTIVSRKEYSNSVNLKANFLEEKNIDKDSTFLSFLNENHEFKKIKTKNALNVQNIFGTYGIESEVKNGIKRESVFSLFNQNIGGGFLARDANYDIENNRLYTFELNQREFSLVSQNSLSDIKRYKFGLQGIEGYIVDEITGPDAESYSRNTSLDIKPGYFSSYSNIINKETNAQSGNGFLILTDLYGVGLNLSTYADELNKNIVFTVGKETLPSIELKVSNEVGEISSFFGLQLNNSQSYSNSTMLSPIHSGTFTTVVSVNGQQANENGNIEIPVVSKGIAPIQGVTEGISGEIRAVDGYIYVCSGGTAWTRAALSTF